MKVNVHELREYQRCNTARGDLVTYWHEIAVGVFNNLTNVSMDWSDRNELYAGLPHVKRKLRMRAIQELQLDSSDRQRELDFMRGPVRGNLKTQEWAKSGKIPRMICDLTTQGSMRAPWLPEATKDMRASHPFSNGNMRMTFIKTLNMDQLTGHFVAMEHPVRPECIYFSDDACFAMPVRNGWLYGNMDISSCDTHNGNIVFDAWSRCVPGDFQEDAAALGRQLLRPIKIGYGRGSLLFQPKERFEYSGSTLTTEENNIAIETVLYHLFHDYNSKVTECEAKELVEQRLKTCGWSMKIQWCGYAELQFLKCSPCKTTTGQIRACLNLGVLLRALGQTFGDLPGSSKQTLEDRAFDFNRGVVSGFMHAGNHTLYRVLAEKFRVEKFQPFPHYVFSTLTCSTSPMLDDTSVLERYGLSLPDFYDLIDALSVATFGEVVDTCASRKIMQVDYDL